VGVLLSRLSGLSYRLPNRMVYNPIVIEPTKKVVRIKVVDANAVKPTLGQRLFWWLVMLLVIMFVYLALYRPDILVLGF